MNKLCLLFSLLLVVAFGFVNGGKLEYDIDKSKEKIGIYELKNGNMSVKFTNWGATIMSLVIPDKHGKRGDIVLGYDTVKDYKNDTTFFGSVVGRVANRIGGARFSLNGAQYKLPKNDGNNTLHGGPKGFADVIWKVMKINNHSEDPTILFGYDSKDDENGFPGEIRVTVRYLLRSDNRLRVTMKARALKKATPVNLAQHTYWNLGNHDSGDILSEEIQLFASRFTPVDEHLIPTGVLSTVRGTPYDFLKPRTIGSRIRELGKGYDINYVIDGPDDPKKLKKTAIVKDKKSGRMMKVYTNQAGVQFYSGNLIKREKGKGGFIYKPHAGLCLETQGFPDALNHQNFPSQIISPGKPYKHKMLFKFLTAKDNKSDKSSRLAEIDFD
ncbi:aldose 1-epimerase-like [Hibiscus syriacus]|uniref:Aldose 1-epimerase n=1 Tax=Hibiscus syriacus TaxID=106335 RepID=A0A6A2Y9V0_HIBSY|nr:galactose mutarotase-like [Hibiscus syriacus]KAE8668637.1 aldose 1-epimerase-like [Hibiscus syriacus]